MTSLVTIPDCSASQLVESSTIPLAFGTLDLLQDDQTRALTLKMGDFAFPLVPNTPVFTHSENALWYFFSIPAVSGSYVRVALPEGIAVSGSEEEKLRDRFETILVEYKLLKTGVEAVGDELGAKVKEEARHLGNLIRSQVDSYTDSHPATEDPVKLGPTTDSIANKAVSGSATAASYAAAAAGMFATATIALGAKVVHVFAGSDEDTDLVKGAHDNLTEAGIPVDGVVAAVAPVWEGGKSAVTGVGEATVGLTSDVGKGVHEVIQHDLGPDSAELASKAAETGSNIGSIAKSVFVDTSPVKIALQAATTKGDGPGPQ